MPLMLELKQLEVVEEDFRVLEDLKPLEIDASSSLIEEEETSGCTSRKHGLL